MYRVLRGVQQEHGEVGSVPKMAPYPIAENGRTKTAHLVAITTLATIAIPSGGIDVPQNNTIWRGRVASRIFYIL